MHRPSIAVVPLQPLHLGFNLVVLHFHHIQLILLSHFVGRSLPVPDA